MHHRDWKQLEQWLCNVLGMAPGDRIAIEGYIMIRTPKNRGHVLQWYMTLPKSLGGTVLKVMPKHHIMAQRVGKAFSPDDPAFHETLVQLCEESGKKNIDIAVEKLSELKGYNGLWASAQGVSARFNAAGIANARKTHGSQAEKDLNKNCTAVTVRKTFQIEGVPALITSVGLQNELCIARDEK